MTGEEVNQAALERSGDARFDDIKYAISDWRTAEKIKMDISEIDELVAYLKAMARQNASIRTVTLTRPDKTGNSLAAYYLMLCEELPWKLEILHDLNNAYEWFGVANPGDPIEQYHMQFMQSYAQVHNHSSSG